MPNAVVVQPAIAKPARGMTVLEYRIRQRRFLIVAGAYRSALRFRGVLDEPFI